MRESRKAFEPDETSQLDLLKNKHEKIKYHIENIEAQTTLGSFEKAVHEAEAIEKEIIDVPNSEREIAFKCVSSYKACKAEENGTEDRVLCGIALAICWAKEVVPLAG